MVASRLARGQGETLLLLQTLEKRELLQSLMRVYNTLTTHRRKLGTPSLGEISKEFPPELLMKNLLLTYKEIQGSNLIPETAVPPNLGFFKANRDHNPLSEEEEMVVEEMMDFRSYNLQRLNRLKMKSFSDEIQKSMSV